MRGLPFEDEGLRRVVVEQLVLESLDADGVFGVPLAVDLERADGDLVLALRNLALLGIDLERAAEDLDFALVLVVRVDGDVHLERLPLADLRGDGLLVGMDIGTEVQSHFSAYVWVEGPSGFAAFAPGATPTESTSLSVDLDGDGLPDLAGVTDTALWIHWGKGNWSCGDPGP